MHAGICESVPVSKCSYGFNLVQCLSLQIKKLKHREAYTDLMVAEPWPYTERRQGGWLLLFGQMFSFQEINEYSDLTVIGFIYILKMILCVYLLCIK